MYIVTLPTHEISPFPTVQENVMKHTTPLTKSYFFKNENAADRVTLLGIYVFILVQLRYICYLTIVYFIYSCQAINTFFNVLMTNLNIQFTY